MIFINVLLPEPVSPAIAIFCSFRCEKLIVCKAKSVSARFDIFDTSSSVMNWQI
jgi:hypothetical protein